MEAERDFSAAGIFAIHLSPVLYRRLYPLAIVADFGDRFRRMKSPKTETIVAENGDLCKVLSPFLASRRFRRLHVYRLGLYCVDEALRSRLHEWPLNRCFIPLLLKSVRTSGTLVLNKVFMRECAFYFTVFACDAVTKKTEICKPIILNNNGFWYHTAGIP